MAVAKLEYEIGADLSKFDLSIIELNALIKKFTAQASSASKDGLAPLNAEIAKLIQYKQKLQTIGLPTDLPDNAKRSRIALTDLSRVVQDLPFGFIGIQNNIPALVQSFQSLTKEGGGLIGGLKLLGQSLIGPSGVFFAFSAVTSLITIGIKEYGSLGNAVDALFGKFSLSKKALLDYNKALSESIGSTATESAEITILTKTLTDLSQPLKNRQAAYIELKKISPDVVAGIDLENISTKEAISLINENAKSIKKLLLLKAQEVAISNILTKNSEQLAVLQIEENKLKKEQSNAQLDLNKSKTNGNIILGAGRTAEQQAISSLSSLTKQINANKLEQVKLNKVAQEYINILDPTIKSIAEIDLKTNESTEGLKKQNKAKADATKNADKLEKDRIKNAKKNAEELLKIQQDLFDREDAAFKVSQDAFIATLNDKQKEEFNAIVDYENQRKTLLRANINDFTAIDEELRIKQQQIADKYNEIALKAEEKFKKERLRIQEEVAEAGRNQFESTFIKRKGVSKEEKDAKALEQSYLNIGKTIFSNVINPLNQLFDVVLSKGEKSWEDFTESVVESLKKLVAKLAAAAAIAGILSLATGGTAGGGVSFIKAFGSIFGGGLGGGGVANPSFGGVQPGGMQMAGSVNMVLRGQDLVGSLNRTNSQFSRVG